jgi:hypothetical protein
MDASLFRVRVVVPGMIVQQMKEKAEIQPFPLTSTAKLRSFGSPPAATVA